MQALADAARADGRVYFTGGATAGSRFTTSICTPKRSPRWSAVTRRTSLMCGKC
jgi:hypothetical protein